jgi:16S rRNA (uracil1498-N3)-methyltransferase
MQPRAYAPDLDPSQPITLLSAEESGHLVRVLRLGAGARVLVFDGRGAQYLARIATAAKDSVTLSLLEPAPPAPESRVRLTLAQAVLKGDKMDAVVRDATMMGVSSVIPLITERTVIPRSAVELGRVRERWHRIAVASAKQCGRAIVPEIGPPERLTTLFETPELDLALRLQLIEPTAAGELDEETAQPLPEEPPAHVMIAIGPEGGWAPEEVEQAREAGWRGWTVGARTLRAESAPLAALSILTYAWRL